VRILFAGTPAAAVPTLQRLHAAGHQIVGVITAPAAPAGRGRKLTASPVSVVANEIGIPVFEFANINSPEAQAEILELNYLNHQHLSLFRKVGSTCISRFCPPIEELLQFSVQSSRAKKSPAPVPFGLKLVWMMVRFLVNSRSKLHLPKLLENY
jgi:hypothetical protein